ncbi:MAG TPA: diguanylate cyclase [Polyangia bacterium]|jgi:diguanylate cyclase (GGDEF)-like protein|nr:diguanylate cyclase [Polyangia bacterium]
MADKDAEPPIMPRAVLLIDPTKSSRDKGAGVLESLGLEPRLASDAFEAHALVDGTAAVIAAHPAALEIYPRLRTMGIPFVASLSTRQARPQAIAHQVGADAYIIRPYKKDTLGVALYAVANARLLRDRALRAEQALADVSGVKRYDSTSGMLHIDLFKTLLPLEIRRARRHGYPIAICVVSLDPLPKAREVTAEMAQACEPFIRGAVRDVDLAVRYGDGRFLVFLPHTDLRGAEAVGRRVVNEIRNCRLRAGGVELMLTASVGIATPRPGKPPSFSRLIRDAHAAVKAAQLKGGDRAVVR